MSRDPQCRILDAAFELFTHYGFKKTTIGEIAKHASVSRPTLYARFDTKEQLFASVIDRYVDDLVAEVEVATADMCTLHDKLTAAFDIAIVRAFEKAHGHTLKRELLELDDPRINEALEAAHHSFDRMLTRLIKASDVNASALGSTAPKLGRMLHAAAKGFKESARDTKELRQMLQGLVRLVQAATEDR